MSREDWARWEAKRMKWVSKDKLDKGVSRRSDIKGGIDMVVVDELLDQFRERLDKLEDSLGAIEHNCRVIAHAASDNAGEISNIIFELERIRPKFGLFEGEDE